MALEHHSYLDSTEEGPAPVSSRLLMIPGLLVVCLTVAGVLYALANTVVKPAHPSPARPLAPVQRKASNRSHDRQVHRVSRTAAVSMHTGVRPGQPAGMHHS